MAPLPSHRAEDPLDGLQPALRAARQRLARGQHRAQPLHRLLHHVARRAGEHLRQGGQGLLGVQQQHEELHPHHRLEGRQVHAGAVLPVHLPQQFEAALVRGALGQADIEHGADQRLRQPALGDALMQFRRALAHQLPALRLQPRTAARRPVVGPHAQRRLHGGGAVEPLEEALAGRVAHLPVEVERAHDLVGEALLHRQEGIVRRGGPAVLPHLLRQRLQHPQEGVVVGEHLVAKPQRMHPAQPVRRGLVARGPHGGLHIGAVEAEIDARKLRHRGEAPVLLLAAADDHADVVQVAAGEARDVVRLHQLRPRLVRQPPLQLRLVEPGRQHVDQVDVGGELLVLLARHRAGHEDPQMADAFVHGIDDGLPVGADLLQAAIEIGDPAQRLLRRGDVVALGAEDDDRRADVAQVEHRAVAHGDLGRGEPVADEKVIDDRLHLARVHQHMAAPPALELQVARWLGVDIGVDVVLLGPDRVGGVQRLEVLHQIGAVEDAVAQVARQRRHPGAAQQPAQIAHRAAALRAGPVGERRAGDDDRAEQLGPHRRRHHHLPARLAVADHHRLAVALAVQLAHALDEERLGDHHVLDRLPRQRPGQEADEVAGMARPHRHAQLAVRLESADAGRVAGTRVEDDEGTLERIDLDAFRRQDAHQPVIHRAFQLAPIHHQFGVIAEHVRRPLRHVLMILVAALPQHIQEEDPALPGIDRVGHALRPGIDRWVEQRGHQGSGTGRGRSGGEARFAVLRVMQCHDRVLQAFLRRSITLRPVRVKP